MDPEQAQLHEAEVVGSVWRILGHRQVRGCFAEVFGPLHPSQNLQRIRRDNRVPHCMLDGTHGGKTRLDDQAG